MSRKAFAAIITVFASFSGLTAQNIVPVPDSGSEPVTISRKITTVRKGDVKYNYTEVFVVPIPGHESEVSDEMIRRYEPYARKVRDSLLFCKDYRGIERWMMDAIAMDKKNGTFGDAADDGSVDFDISQVKWRDGLIGVDVFGGISSTLPLNSTGEDSAPALCATADIGLFLNRFFIRPSLCFGKTFLKHSPAGADAAFSPYFNSSINVGYEVFKSNRLAVSPFIGKGRTCWAEDFDDLADFFVTPRRTLGNYTLAEGVEITFFRPKRVLDFSDHESHVNTTCFRLRLYADQVIFKNGQSPIPTVNMSLCIGSYRRNIKK